MRRFTLLLVITFILFQIVSCKKNESSENEINVYYKNKILTILDDATETMAYFTALTDWYVTVDEKYSSWLSTNVVAGVAGSYNLTIITEVNDTFESRTGYVVLCGENQQSSITVTQKGKQIIVFNDQNFESFCIENFDLDTSGYVTTAEAHLATELNCPSKEIADFSGIEFFTNITSANLSGNNQLILSVSQCKNLQYLDVSNCVTMGGLELGEELKKLAVLNCSSCNLSSLSVDSCEMLSDFNCRNNTLLSLNLTFNSNLKNLKCNGNPELTTIFVTEDIELENVEKDDFTMLVYPNEIVKIPDEVFKNYLLEEYDRNRDKQISVEEALDADVIRCFGKNGNIKDVKSLEGIEYFPNIVYLDCSYTNITQLDLTCNPKLQNICCGFTKLNNLRISTFSPLKLLDCSGCKEMRYLSLSMNNHLKTLKANNNSLETIDFDFCTSLEDVDVSFNKLSYINFVNTPSLNYLNCSHNQIQSFTIANCDSLTFVFCQNNQIDTLNICSEKIRDINLSNNKFSGTLDLSNYLSLHSVTCDTNQISSIYLPQISTIASVSLNYNKLNEIDIAYMPEIRYFYATNNQLTKFRADYCEKLEKVFINDNNLMDTVDFSTTRELKQVWLQNNPNLKFIWGPKGVSPLEIRHDDTAVLEYK